MATIDTAGRLADVAREDWDSLVGDDGFYLSYDWLRYVEAEAHERSRYLLYTDSGAPAGALVLNSIEEAATPRYRAEHFRELLGLDGTALVAGATRGYRSALLLAPSAANRGEILAGLLDEAIRMARREGHAGIVLPFLTTSGLAEVAGVARVRAAFDIPEAEITDCAASLDAYAERAPRRVRNRIHADRAQFAKAGWVIRERRLEDCWEEAARLLHHLQSKYGHQEHTQRVLREAMAGQARTLSPRSVVFTCEDDSGIAGISVCYRWRTTMYGRIAGFDYTRLRGAREYFNITVYEPLRYAGEAGLRRYHLGIGSWEAKAYRGAALRPLWSAVIPADAGTGAGGSSGAPGLDLVNDAVARQWMADIAGRGIPVDEAEWRLPAELAAAGSIALAPCGRGRRGAIAVRPPGVPRAYGDQEQARRDHAERAASPPRRGGSRRVREDAERGAERLARRARGVQRALIGAVRARR